MIATVHYRKVIVQRYATSMKEFKRTYVQPSPSWQLCPFSANTKSAIIQERLKTHDHIPSGPKNRSSGLLYRSTKGSLMWGVDPGMRRSIIAYRPSGPVSKTARKVELMECIHWRISRSTFWDSFLICRSLDLILRYDIKLERRENTNEGKIVPLAPPSGISLFFSDCVAARL